MFNELCNAMKVAEGSQKIMNFERFGRLISNIMDKKTVGISRYEFVSLVSECIIGLELTSNDQFYRSAVGSFFGKRGAKKKKEKVVEEKVVNKNKKKTKKPTSLSTKNRIQQYFILDQIGALHYGEP
jgi:hypothetical protein